MTSLSTNHLAFPGNFSPLTERRVSAQSWVNALRPYFRYVTTSGEDGAPQVVVENGNDVVLTLTESEERRDHWPLWTLEVYSRRSGVEYSYKVGNLQDVLVSLLHEV
nr:MAG TPA: hypothetical protein [Caudoviricetes sp.]DAY40364.1 MAG TPA: hypothetical protein [Caudoviricetes sp.]